VHAGAKMKTIHLQINHELTGLSAWTTARHTFSKIPELPGSSGKTWKLWSVCQPVQTIYYSIM